MFTTLVVLFVFCKGMAQLEHSSLSISPDLRENANAVVRNESLIITIEAVDKMVVNQEFTITIFNDSGDGLLGATSEFYDDNSRVRNQQAVIYNDLGKEIKKFRKSDFIDRSNSDGDLFNDNRIKFLNYTPTTYPYTITYKSEVVYSQTAFIYPWVPIPGYYVGLEKSYYELRNPANIPVRFKENGFDGFDIKSNTNATTLRYTVENIKAVQPERLSPGMESISPKVLVALSQFSLGEVIGSADTWDTFGKWQYDHLVQGLDEIPAVTKRHITTLVEGVEDPREKARIIYKYVQNKTRYISVQLGIGGWKPFPAEEVDALGYGDCKGLTNYTKALLKTQGINSYYTIVYAGNDKKNIDANFTSMQGNHVILNIPMEGGDVWLECTSQTIPFNFLGDFTDDRDVLVITPQGGIIKHTPKYDSKFNYLTTTGTCDLNSTGDISVQVQMDSKGIQYDARFGMETEKEDVKEKHYKNYWGYIDNISLESVKIDNNRKDISLTENILFNARQYATFAGNDMLVPINVLNRSTYLPKRYKNRTQPLEIPRGYTDVDEVVLNLPTDYTLSYLPKNTVIESEFGNYKTEVVKLSETQLKYTRTLEIKDGLFPKESYAAYREFRKRIAKNDNQKIVLTKV